MDLTKDDYTEWKRYSQPIVWDKDGKVLTVVGERYEINTGRRQHLILESTIIDYRNADWISVNDVMVFGV